MTAPLRPPAAPRRPSRPEMHPSSALLLLLIVIPVHAVAGGLLVRYMWHRLVVPVFGAMPGLPHHLTLAAAIAIALVVGYLTGDEVSAATDERPFVIREVMWWMMRGLALGLTFAVGFWL